MISLKNGFTRKGSKKICNFSDILKKTSQNGYGNCWPIQEEGLKKIKNKNRTKSVIIPCELLLTGRHQRRSGSLRTDPYPLLPCHSPWQLPMQGIHSHRFRIRYTSYCQLLLPTSSLHRICFTKDKK